MREDTDRIQCVGKKEADGVGFEPTVGCPTLVFKTSAFDHSATHPLIDFLHLPETERSETNASV